MEARRPSLPKKASIVARVDNKSLVLTVDLTTSEVTVHETGSHYSYPTMTLEELNAATFSPLENANFNRMIVERKVDLADLGCLPLSTGGGGDDKVVAAGYEDDGCDNVGGSRGSGGSGGGRQVNMPSTSKHDDVDEEVVEIKNPDRSSTTISLAAQSSSVADNVGSGSDGFD
ncbi:hypothetical protein C1H46_001666 [Malus baccata]|uniref:Uncharacterized protein n=1 Tax=Malus baccata TaxID=106549 RepID=A0A540NQA7_MALBA|nr:hypothetical protein C1H46_001666 [Malus baccata]